MKYPYTVKHNGNYYPAGTDVPVGETAPKAAVKVEETKPEPKATQKPSVKKK